MSDVHEGSDFENSNFSEFISRERDRLRAEREQIFGQQEELQRKLDAVNREFVAIEAYEGAKTGKAARQMLAGRRPRAPRGSKREALLEVIQQGGGLSRGEILERMGLRGDKAGEISVSNGLAALAKRNEVRREGGKYYSVSPDQGEAELSPGAPEGDQIYEADSEIAQD